MKTLVCSFFLSISGMLFGQLSVLDSATNLAQNGHREESIDVLKEFLIFNPESTEALVLLGRVYSWEKKYDTSLIYLNRALKTDSANPEVSYVISTVYLWMKDYSKSATYNDSSLLRRPSKVDYVLRKSLLKSKQGSDYEALSFLKQHETNDSL